MKFDRLDMVKRFHRSGHCGFYLAVVRRVTVTAGDAITRIPTTDVNRISIADAYREITGN